MIDFKLKISCLAYDMLNKSSIQLKKKNIEADKNKESLGSIPQEIGDIPIVVSDLESNSHLTQPLEPPAQEYTTSIEFFIAES